MKLLIVTQAVDRNDPVLGFFHRWIAEFASSCEQVIVVCLKKGPYDLPLNVEVLSLGKDAGVSRIRYLWNFFRYIWTRRAAYDAVFVHMNPVYVVLAGAFWRLSMKKVGLWYTHKHVDLKLRVAEKLAHVVFSASPESFRLPTKKLSVLGHGIDTAVFHPPIPTEKRREGERIVLTSGRISPTKNLHLLIEAFTLLKWQNSRLVILGDARGSVEMAYAETLRRLVAEKGLEARVVFAGSKTQGGVAEALRQADVFVNLSQTGSLDKAVLEAMACGVYTISSNEAFRETADAYLSRPAPSDVSRAIDAVLAADARGTRQAYVTETHQLAILIRRIVRLLGTGKTRFDTL